jgi:hypothetical protein
LKKFEEVKNFKSQLANTARLSAASKRQRDVDARSIDAAFSTGSVTSIAQSKRLGRHTVHHSAKTAAFVFLKLQEVFLTELRDRAARRPQPCFDLLFDRIEFDETHQTLSVKLSDLLTATQQSSKWSVSCIIHWLGFRIAGQRETQFVPLIRLPTVNIGSVSAGCLWDAVVEQASYQPIRKLLNDLRQMSVHCFTIRELDAAGPNLKFLAHELAALRLDDKTAKVLYSFLLCSLHQGNLLLKDLMSSKASLELAGVAHALACCLQEGNYFARLVCAVEDVVRGRLLITTEAMSTAQCDEQKLMLDLFFPRPMGKMSEKQAALQQELRDEYGLLFNCPMLGPLAHACLPLGACKCKSKEDTVKRMASILLRTMFARRPMKPELSEWTAVRRCFVWLAFSSMTHNLFRDVWKSAVSKWTAENHRSSSVSAHMVDVDWVALTGKRISVVSDAVAKPAWTVHVIMRTIFIDACELWSRWLQTISKMPDVVPLYEVLDPKRSMRVLTSQFASAILTGRSPVCMLIYKLRGCTTFLSFQARDPTLAHEMRTMGVRLSKGEWLRHGRRYRSWPHWLAAVADTELSMDDRRSVGAVFFQDPLHDLDEGFGRPLRKRLPSAESLFSYHIQLMLDEWARAHILHSQQAEDRHAQHRRILDPHTTLELFRARAVTAEVRRVFELPVLEKMLNEEDAAPPCRKRKAPSGQGPGNPLRSTMVRWHNWCVTKGTIKVGEHVKSNEEWDNLSPDEQATFEAHHKAQLDAELSSKRLKPLPQDSAVADRALCTQYNRALADQHAAQLESPGELLPDSKDKTVLCVCEVRGSRRVFHNVGRTKAQAAVRRGQKQWLRKRPLCIEPGIYRAVMQHHGIASAEKGAARFDAEFGDAVAKDRHGCGNIRHDRPCLGVCVMDRSRAGAIRRGICKKVEEHLLQDITRRARTFESSVPASCYDLRHLLSWHFVSPQGSQRWYALACDRLASGEANIWRRCFALLMLDVTGDDGGSSVCTFRQEPHVRCEPKGGCVPLPFTVGVIDGVFDFRISATFFASLVTQHTVRVEASFVNKKKCLIYIYIYIYIYIHTYIHT